MFELRSEVSEMPMKSQVLFGFWSNSLYFDGSNNPAEKISGFSNVSLHFEGKPPPPTFKEPRKIE